MQKMHIVCLRNKNEAVPKWNTLDFFINYFQNRNNSKFLVIAKIATAQIAM